MNKMLHYYCATACKIALDIYVTTTIATDIVSRQDVSDSGNRCQSDYNKVLHSVLGPNSTCMHEKNKQSQPCNVLQPPF